MKTLWDIIGLGGAGAVVYGSWLMFAPLGWIVFGAIALSVSILGAKRWQS